MIIEVTDCQPTKIMTYDDLEFGEVFSTNKPPHADSYFLRLKINNDLYYDLHDNKVRNVDHALGRLTEIFRVKAKLVVEP